MILKKSLPGIESNPKPFGVDATNTAARLHWGPNSWIRITHLAFAKPFVKHSKIKFHLIINSFRFNSSTIISTTSFGKGSSWKVPEVISIVFFK